MTHSEATDATFLQTQRTQIKRLPQRGEYDRQTIYDILDEGLICQVGFVVEGQPFVIPTAYGRVDDRLYIHGSPASRMLRTLKEGVEVCVTVTLLDGLVLARSAFHHSMNYRSVVVFGCATLVEDAEEKLEALKAFTEHVMRDRWAEVRPPNQQELAGTLVLALPLTEASAKMRSGAPIDDEADYRSARLGRRVAAAIDNPGTCCRSAFSNRHCATCSRSELLPPTLLRSPLIYSYTTRNGWF